MPPLSPPVTPAYGDGVAVVSGGELFVFLSLVCFVGSAMGEIV